MCVRFSDRRMILLTAAMHRKCFISNCLYIAVVAVKRHYCYLAVWILMISLSSPVLFFVDINKMKHINDDKQMTDVWRLPAIAPWEKKCGKHPTQKPLCVLSRIILASTKPRAWILDPFAGSSTTGIAANLLGRQYLGIERDEKFAAISKDRREEIENLDNYFGFQGKIADIVKAKDSQTELFACQEALPIIPLSFLS